MPDSAMPLHRVRFHAPLRSGGCGDWHVRLDSGKGTIGYLADSIRWSLAGWRAAWRSERSLRLWALANAVSAGLAFALPLDAWHRGNIIALGILVLAAELLNTAVETVVDMIAPQQDSRAARAKDCASAAVTLAALAAGMAWAAALWSLAAG